MAGSGYTIIHVTTERGWRGGEQQVSLLTDGLAARGHRCIVLCPPGTPIFENRAKAGMAEPLKYVTEMDVFAAARLADLAARTRADLIHAHTGHAHALAWMAARKHPVPAVVSRRVDFPVGGNFLSRRKYFAPCVFYIAISEGVKEVLVRGGVEEERISVVHSGVDPVRFAPRADDCSRDEALAAELGAKPGRFLLVNVAALTDHKDQATLLRSAARLRDRQIDFQLVIAGSGELEQELKALCNSLSLDDRVHFAGYVTDVGRLLRAADLFVLSSHLEGLGTSILDAFAVGLPVVATNTGGVPEIVTHGHNGLLVPPRDPAALADAIETMLTNPMLRRALADQARETVRSRFTNDAMVDGTVAAYRDILATYHRARAAAQQVAAG